MEQKPSSPVKKLGNFSLNQIFTAILVSSIVLGIGAGYILASGKTTGSLTTTSSDGKTTTGAPKTAAADKSTFRDFAEGTIEKREAPKDGEYTEGTHVLVRTGAVPVALTSSVVDLSEYEGKKVVVYGETQKAIKAGWLMDVGLVETK
jgi:hypothetical protein